MGPNASENFKTLLLLQITAKSYEINPQLDTQSNTQNQVRHIRHL